MANATLGARIKDLIGFDYASNDITTEDEALENACAEVIDSLPTEVLLRNAEAPSDLHTGGDTVFLSSGKKVLRVIRYDGAIARSCSEIEFEDFLDWTNDTESLYFPTKFSPVYAIDPTDGTLKLKVFPTLTGASAGVDGTARVYAIPYPTGADLDTMADGKVSGVPKEAEHAIALKASMHILDTMISDKIQDDEDQEMMQMLQGQKQNLDQTYGIEMARLTKQGTASED